MNKSKKEEPAKTVQGAHLSLKTTEPTLFGHGWISGVLGLGLSLLGFGAVLCFHFPSLLTMPELRNVYPLPYVRAILHLVLVGGFFFGTISILLRQNKAFGLSAIFLVLVSAVLGGSRIPIDEVKQGPFLGMDWFLLNLLLFSAVCVPLERLFALRPDQPTFRFGWKADLTYFFVNSMLVQITTLLTLFPATVLFRWAVNSGVQQWVSELPLAVQIAGVLFCADLTQYWVHRLFHRVPALWKFHAIHHSAEKMDWLAGARLHLIDVVVTRGLSYVPIFVLGFSDTAMIAYAVMVTIQATLIHANVRWEFSWVRWLVVTPRYHHWHHSAEKEAIDKNFAVHVPIWDWLFGTYYMPGDRWPDSYGISGDSKVPSGFFRQLLYPFVALFRRAD